MLLNKRTYNHSVECYSFLDGGNIYDMLRARKCRFEVSYKKGVATYSFEGTDSDYEAVKALITKQVIH